MLTMVYISMSTGVPLIACCLVGVKCVCFSEYNKVLTTLNSHWDRFFVRANFTRPAECEGDLDFHKDDILIVVNTLRHGSLGFWFAWLVDDQGRRMRCGSIPSKLR